MFSEYLKTEKIDYLIEINMVLTERIFINTIPISLANVVDELKFTYLKMVFKKSFIIN